VICCEAVCSTEVAYSIDLSLFVNTLFQINLIN
jgi:hypothetical protein